VRIPSCAGGGALKDIIEAPSLRRPSRALDARTKHLSASRSPTATGNTSALTNSGDLPSRSLTSADYPEQTRTCAICSFESARPGSGIAGTRRTTWCTGPTTKFMLAVTCWPNSEIATNSMAGHFAWGGRPPMTTAVSIRPTNPLPPPTPHPPRLGPRIQTTRGPRRRA